jgi:hypothetical protein
LRLVQGQCHGLVQDRDKRLAQGQSQGLVKDREKSLVQGQGHHGLVQSRDKRLVQGQGHNLIQGRAKGLEGTSKKRSSIIGSPVWYHEEWGLGNIAVVTKCRGLEAQESVPHI